MARWRAGITVVAVVLVATACTAQGDPAPKMATAAPGQYVTVAGAGPDPQAPDAIDAPVDLAEAPGGALLFLGEHGTVYRIGPDGRRTEYAAGPGATDKRWPIEALSMALRRDGTILIAVIGEEDEDLAVYLLEQGKEPEEIGKFGKPKEVASVRLLEAPDGSSLLLKDGKFVDGDELGKVAVPSGLGKIATAVADGDQLLLGLEDELVWLRGEKIIKRLELPESITADWGGTLALHGSDSLFLGNAGSYIHRVRKDGIRATVMLGRGGSRGCGERPDPGGTMDPRKKVSFGYPETLILVRDQLYVADPNCRRILAIGLPTPEYVRPDKLED